MQTGPILHLNQQQAEQLLAHCRAYRAYLWQCLMPCPQRNQALRTIQMVQGQVEHLQEHGHADCALPLRLEDRTTLQQLCLVLLQQYASAPPSAERTRRLGEVAGLRVLVERACRHTQALGEVRRGG